MKKKPLVPIILCGGFGSRLWPLSRKSFPKQYLSIKSDAKKSLLQLTLERIKTLENLQPPILVCNEEHRFIAAEQMREINVKPQAILLEPFGKNTAPAIVVSTLKAIEKNKDCNILVLSSDHNIEDQKKFKETIIAGINYADYGRIVTFGIVPTYPETGYGYIEASEELDKNKLLGRKIKRFIEKPNYAKASYFLKNKKFTWNSGIFLFEGNTLIKEVNNILPNLLTACKESLKNNLIDLDFQRLDKKGFHKCPNISIDIAIMEKTGLGTVVPLDAGWNDIGSWNSVWEISKKDKDGNLVQGKVFTNQTKDSYLRSEGRLLVCLGVSNLIAVETNDAILIADKSKSQEVKSIVEILDKDGFEEATVHKKIYRPWGNYLSLSSDSNWQVKLINVKPGERLSLQMHEHRSEHWIVVKGNAKVEIDSKEIFLCPNQSIYIPLGSKHRLSNMGQTDLFLIEVQSGSYLGEDDIIRFEDIYGRLKN